jgi:xanthosine phosphorylase
MSGEEPQAAAAVIAARAPGFRPRLGLVLGSGLGGFAETIEGPVVIDYADLPGFPRPSVAGHAGRLLLGRAHGVDIAVLQGRVHVYEGRGMAAVLAPVRTLKLLGAEILLLTNAAGSLDPTVGPGRLVAIADHINFMPGNPLIGPNDDRFGPRFPSLRDAYDPALRRGLRQAADAAGIALSEGVYLACSGPSFETPAEIRAFRILGADLVGMSTVPEAIAARHCGLRVAAVSVITNLAEGLGDEALSHTHTLAMAERAAADLGRLIAGFLEGLDGRA